jgi:small subunit ribosomal protein S8
MSMTDSLADMLTRIRNGQGARLFSVDAPFSRLSAGVLDVLKLEGFISTYHKDESVENKPRLVVELKYSDGKPVINEIKRSSRPGKRYYSKIEALPKVRNGLGIYILSTSRGVVSDYEARLKNVGGEVLCSVF